MQSGSVWCPKCRMQVKEIEQSVNFCNQRVHKACLLKEGVNLIGNMFHSDSEMIALCRKVKGNWTAFGQLALEAYRRVCWDAEVFPESRQFVFDILRQCFCQILEGAFDESDEVIPMTVKAGSEQN